MVAENGVNSPKIANELIKLMGKKIFNG